MKIIITLVSVLIVAGAKLASASGLEELRTSRGGGDFTITAPAVPPPSAQPDPFDVRKVFVMPAAETWKGPFVIQFSKGADLATVTKILKSEGLEAKELADNGGGFYAKIETDHEFAAVKVMRLTDYTSVANVQVSRRLWDLMTSY